jgi:superfamily I DNA/RNA helicase
VIKKAVPVRSDGAPWTAAEKVTAPSQADSGHDPPWLDGIEGDYLRRLIESEAKVIRVVAGPGSGKTTGLKRRIKRLVQGQGMEASSIFVGTFTRAIATDLVEALGADLEVRTLHSLAYKLLRDHRQALGDRKLRFLLEFEEEAMLFDVGLEVGGQQRDRERSLRRLQASWAQRRSLPDARFWGAVERWLRHHGGMLIGEVPHLASTALANADIPGGLYDEVIIDEYQDLTACEQQLVELIWSRKASLVVLGDDDQSIYGFRFNHREGITGFAARWGDVDDIRIPENRRCATSIVAIANQLMAEVGSSKDPMIARRAEPGRAAFVSWPSVEDEVAGLAAYIRSRPDEQFLVLVPRRFIGYRLQEAVGEDAQTAFRQEALEHPLTQERFALASLMADPNDRVAFRAWLGFDGGRPTKPPGRNAAACSSVIGLGDSVIDIARGLHDRSIRLTGAGQDNVRKRAARLLDELEIMPLALDRQIEYLFNPGLVDRLPADTAEEKRRWIRRDLEELQGAALAILAEEGDGNLGSVIARLRYRIATRAPLGKEKQCRVKIMTLHSAKGLEGDAIVIAGLADQMVPGPQKHDPAETDAHRAEQRRLIYVAVTRAKGELVVSWPQSVAYSDASSNGIRIHLAAIRTIAGARRVKLTRSTLLPDDLPVAVPGVKWLHSLGLKA